jgi:hypothetical protein
VIEMIPMVSGDVARQRSELARWRAERIAAVNRLVPRRPRARYWRQRVLEGVRNSLAELARDAATPGGVNPARRRT